MQPEYWIVALTIAVILSLRWGYALGAKHTDDRWQAVMRDNAASLKQLLKGDA